MVSVQVAGVALLFPFLLKTWRVTAQVIAIAIPFLLAAGVLGGLGVQSVIDSASVISLWIVVLSLWSSAIRSDKSRAIGISLASLLTLGAGVIHYLRLEFDPTSATPNAFEMASPLFTALTALDAPPPPIGWALLITLAVSGLISLRIQRRTRRATA